MQLHDIAHARAGDKGSTSDISVIAYDAAHYDHLRSVLTVEAVRAHFGDIVKGEVVRYELPQLKALKFVLQDALAGGVTRSLHVDVHGKSMSSLLLEMEIPELGVKMVDLREIPVLV